MQLTIQQLPGGFPQSNHAQHSLCSYGRQFHLVHKRIFTVVNLPVHVREAEILHTWVCRNGFFLHIQFIVGDFWLRDGGMDISNCFFQLLGKVCALDGLDRRFLLAILSAFRGDLPQHHLRMLRKILVDGISFRRFTEIHPVSPFHRCTVTLLQKQDVSNHARVGIALKRIVRQTNCADQIGTVGKVLTDRGILLIHRTAGRYHRYHTARTHKVKTFRNKIIVDEKIVAVIPLVRYFVIAERYVAHNTVKKAVRKLHCFKALHRNLVFLVQLLCNAARNAVQLHTVHPNLLHAVRHQTHEIADTTGWFQHVAFGQSHIAQGFIHRLDDRRRSVKRIQGTGTGFLILICREQGLQFGILFRPFRVVFIERLRNAAPAHIPGKYLLLFCGSLPLLCIQCLQHPNGFHIGFILCFRPSCAEIIVRNAEVHRFLFGLCRLFCFCSTVQRKIVLPPCMVDLCRGHRLLGQRFKGFLCCCTADGIRSVLHICDQLHLFWREVRIQQFFQLAACFCHRIDHIHLLRGEILVGHTRIVQSRKDCDFNRFFHRYICLFVQMPNVLQRFRSENRIPGFFCKGHVLQTDRSISKVHRIHTELSIVQFDGGINRQIFLSAEVFRLGMGSIFLLAGQIDVLPLLPELHCL